MSQARRARLAFVSTMFLQPEDTGGRIRTCNTLRGMKGGRFEITLIGPGDEQQRRRFDVQLAALCDRFVPWQPSGVQPRWRRGFKLLSKLPLSVATEVTDAALAKVASTLAQEKFDVVVFDFVHAAALMPPTVDAATVCFTHNVETEIYARHAQQADSAIMRRVWAQQAAKMRRFERTSLARFDGVVAVSERDAAAFARDFDCTSARAIPTGVDLDHFAFQEPRASGDASGGKVVFTGSMDWAANVDGMQFFISEVWPLVLLSRPNARFEAVGRSPPDSLLRLARGQPGVTFTGRVEDVRPHVRDAQVFVIPLRVGGGTRIKAFEAMAMGCPVVSTTLGVEGLEVIDGRHLLVRDAAPALAEAVVALLERPQKATALSISARELVQSRFSHRAAAQAFEDICWDTLNRRRASRP